MYRAAILRFGDELSCLGTNFHVGIFVGVVVVPTTELIYSLVLCHASSKALSIQMRIMAEYVAPFS